MVSNMCRWGKLECNTEVMNIYLNNVGVLMPAEVFEYEEDIYPMQPTPLAVIFWYPPDIRATVYSWVKPDYEDKFDESGALYHMLQYDKHTSGLIALIHAVLNIPNVQLREGSIMQSFWNDSRDLTPAERGELLSCDDDLADVHEDIIKWKRLAMLPGNPPENFDEEFNYHSVAFIRHDGKLYELDGRKAFPVKHGTVTQERLLRKSFNVCLKGVDEYYPENANRIAMLLR